MANQLVFEKLATEIKKPKTYIKYRGVSLICAQSNGSQEEVIYVGTELEFDRCINWKDNCRKVWLLVSRVNVVKMIVATKKYDRQL